MADGHIAGPISTASIAVVPAVTVPSGTPSEAPVEAPHTDRPALDRIGIGVSLTCAVHCIASAALGVVPALAGHVGFLESIELPLLVAALVIGTASLVPATRAHHHRGPLALFIAGMTLLVVSRLVPEGGPELVLTVCGFTPVALAHVWNLRLCRH